MTLPLTKLLLLATTLTFLWVIRKTRKTYLKRLEDIQRREKLINDKLGVIKQKFAGSMPDEQVPLTIHLFFKYPTQNQDVVVERTETYG